MLLQLLQGPIAEIRSKSKPSILIPARSSFVFLQHPDNTTIAAAALPRLMDTGYIGLLQGDRSPTGETH